MQKLGFISAITLVSLPLSSLADEMTVPSSLAPSDALQVAASPFSGEVSIWGQWVMPTGTVRSDDTCDDDSDEYCDNVLGAGLYAGGMYSLVNSNAIYIDLTVDGHLASAPEDEQLAEDNARYAGLGLHYIANNQPDPWGAFATIVGGHGHNDGGDRNGTMVGLGLEKYWGQYYFQGGYMRNITDNADSDEIDDDVDGLFNFSYLRAGSRWALASGEVQGSLAIGSGRATRAQDEAATVNWVQLAAAYSAPIGDSDFDWFVGYQGDYVDGVETDGENFESSILNSLQAGITLNFGASKSPFRTPNFRAPLTNASDFN